MAFDENILRTSMERPHLVILGAGASRAAFPTGDRNGNKLPVMNELVEIVGLESVLRGIPYKGRNFEEIHAELVAKHPAAAGAAETLIADYFAGLRLPDEPTMYDHLILSLRAKDCIATFNWDPFLFNAAARNFQFATPPNLLFLHGNVAIGFCLKDKRKGPAGAPCPACDKPFQSSRLLYPVTHKNYSSDPYISAEWDAVRDFLKSAYVVTVFGYSAPTSDKEAVDLLQAAWGKAADRKFEQFEMIDIKSDEELRRTWDTFVHTHHYETTTDFYESMLPRFPRRTCEALWKQTMEVKFLEPASFPRTAGFPGLYSWLKPLVDEEPET